MKKPFIFAIAAMLSAATVGYSQTTTNSGAKGESGATGTQNQASGTSKQNQDTTAAKQDGQAQQDVAAQPAATTGEPGQTGGQQARKTEPGSGSNKPGGTYNRNGNDVGRFSSSEDTRSMLNSKEAVAEREKNLTEADTTVKKGSGSGSRNMKNKAGQTGNYDNQEIKHNQKTKPRP